MKSASSRPRCHLMVFHCGTLRGGLVMAIDSEELFCESEPADHDKVRKWIGKARREGRDEGFAEAERRVALLEHAMAKVMHVLKLEWVEVENEETGERNAAVLERGSDGEDKEHVED